MEKTIYIFFVLTYSKIFVIYQFYNKWYKSIDLYFILLLIFEMIKNFSKCIYIIDRMKHLMKKRLTTI